MTHRVRAIYATVAMAVFGVLSANAWSIGPEDVARLGKDLTPVGGERAGNKDGSIPAFSGSEKVPAGWAYGKLREEYWQHKSEKPLFVIDASNVDKYADRLTAGQIQMIKQVKGYSMPVYPTHRQCGFPAAIEKNTREGAATSSIAKDGWSLENAALPGVPFPVPSNGIEAIWNFLMRYQGLAQELTDGYTILSPRSGAADPIVTRYQQLTYYPWAEAGVRSPKDITLQSGLWYSYVEPVALAGQVSVGRYYYNKDNESYLYFPGQRRVRRLPNYSYDAPLIGYENQFPIDIVSILYGNPDRFDWKLVGKREIYVPYNNFGMQRFDKKLSETVGPNFINASQRRYELHRVWEIEGTVKAGVRHSAPKKTVYLDEDSWFAVVGDDYDAQGKLWRSKENFTAPQWEIGACALSGSMYADLISGRYIIDASVFGTGKDIKYYAPGAAATDPRFKDSFFTSGSLSSTGER